LKVRNAPQKGKSALIISVSRKAAPHAVTRNRIRRRIRAALSKAGIKPKRPIMLVAEARAAEVPFLELLEEIRRTFRNYE
jgi:ribonuclease P protein component